MKITEIKPQVKRADRYSIYLDKKYSFSLSSEELLDSKLTVGSELDQTQLNIFNKLAERSLAKLQCYHFLSFRLRSEWEMVTYLKRKGYPEDLIKDTIEFLKQKNLVDDLNFSKRWIENRSLLKPSSINKLKLELRQKHINREIINQVLSESPIDEVAVLKEIILKKQKLAKYQDKQTMMMFLARKGFSYDSIKKVLSDIGDSSS